jgi:hypothetical protein
VDGDRAAQRLDPVGQADEPGAPADLRPAGAVVADQQAQLVGGGAGLDLDGRGTGVLGRVGQRLGDDVVGGVAPQRRRLMSSPSRFLRA